MKRTWAIKTSTLAMILGVPAAFFVLFGAASLLAVARADTNSTGPDAANETSVFLPLATPFAAQWIVLVNGSEMKIIPAIARSQDGGTAVSAPSPGVTSQTLRAVVAIANDGSGVASPLQAAR